MTGDLHERKEYWLHPRFGDLGLLKARFTRHRYARHTHPTYVVALITAGSERVRIGRESVLASMGSLLVVNPEEWHDGEAGSDGGWTYRTLYPPVAFMKAIAEELGVGEAPTFRPGVIDDPELANAMFLAHRASESGNAMASEAPMLLAFRHLILRHAERDNRLEVVERSNVHRRFPAYEAIIEKSQYLDFDLQDLAAAGGVTRFQVIRDFKKVTGLTPALFIRDRKLRRANRLILDGASLVEAAIEAGFADQSHLSRVFLAAHGFTPGMLRMATFGHQDAAPP